MLWHPYFPRAVLFIAALITKYRSVSLYFSYRYAMSHPGPPLVLSHFLAVAAASYVARVKSLKVMPRPHNQIDADMASGMGAPDNGPKLRSSSRAAAAAAGATDMVL
jgi:hypothetical protein